MLSGFVLSMSIVAVFVVAKRMGYLPQSLNIFFVIDSEKSTVRER